MNEDNIKQEEAIIREIKRYSKRFLEKMGGFYPFAIGINKNNEIFSIGAYEGNDFPMSQELIDLLEKVLKMKYQKEKLLYQQFVLIYLLMKQLKDLKQKKMLLKLDL